MKSTLLAGLGLAALVAASPAHAAGEKPMFAVQPLPRQTSTRAMTASIPLWTFSWSNGSKSGSEVFVGSDPTSTSGVTVPVYVIPVKLTWSGHVEDPNATSANGGTVVTNTLASPIFQSSVDYVQGGTDLGTTQYEDAFQRASLWYAVSSNQNYHILLGTPTVEPEVSWSVPTRDGTYGNQFGAPALTAYINWFDTQAQKYLNSGKVPANALPIFITSNTYLTQYAKSGCCIGGYHSYNGTYTYSHFTYITKSGAFSQDVSALSHEVGEWLQDPLTNNAACKSGQVWEVGDPLEGDANYGDYNYTVGGFTYHLQDLVLPPYFGTATSVSVNGWSTFQGTSISVCKNGG